MDRKIKAAEKRQSMVMDRLKEKLRQEIKNKIEGDLADRVNLQIYPLDLAYQKLESMLQEGGSVEYPELNPLCSTVYIAIQNIRRELGLPNDFSASEEEKGCQK